MLNSSVLSRVQGAVGVYMTGGFTDLTREEAADYRSNVCGSSAARPWRRHLCELIEQGVCDAGCRLPRFSGCTGAVVEGGYFVTAMHCSDARVTREEPPEAQPLGPEGA